MFKVINLTTFPTARGTFENSIKGQLAARELPRTRALLEDFLRRNRSREELKNKRRRIPFHVESSLVPLRFEVFHDLWSRLPSKISRSEQIKRKFSRRKDRKKRGFDWQLAIKMLPSSPIRFSVYPVYGFAKRTMTARRRIFPSAPLSLFYARCPFSSAFNHFWLALTLCQYHHPRWRQSSTKICLLFRLQLC